MRDIQLGQVSDPGNVRTKNMDALGSFAGSRKENRATGFLFESLGSVGGLGSQRGSVRGCDPGRDGRNLPNRE
jgi:hypothetical protein